MSLYRTSLSVIRLSAGNREQTVVPVSDSNIAARRPLKVNKNNGDNVFANFNFFNIIHNTTINFIAERDRICHVGNSYRVAKQQANMTWQAR